VTSKVEREHRRYAHEATLTCHVGGTQLAGRTRNVSRGGLCADLAGKLAVGTDLVVDVALVFEDQAQSEPLRLPARVAWCTIVGASYQIGLAFRPLPAEVADQLEVFLHHLEDPGAEPPPRAVNVDDRFR
jgi:Tfp pilus assembly protein PilZ